MTKKFVGLVIFVFIVLFCFLLAPLFIRYFNIPPLEEPKLFTYTSDEFSFLKIYYLMKNGDGYYQSFAIARTGFANGGDLSQDVFTWRLPTIFFLWRATAPNGHWIFVEFLAGISLFLISAFLILKKAVNPFLALFGVILLLPYIFDTLKYKTAFLFTEWWGLFFFVYGITSLTYKYQKLSFFLLLLSLMTREIFIIPVFGIFVFNLFAKKDRVFFLSLLVLAGSFYLLHSFFVADFIQSSSPRFTLLSRFHPPYPVNIQSMLSFSMRPFVFYSQKTHFLIEGLGVIGILVGVLKKRAEALSYVFVAIFSFLFTLPFISVKENDYWGILFVPFLLMSVPLLTYLSYSKFRKEH